jgi:hypothetical protein
MFEPNRQGVSEVWAPLIVTVAQTAARPLPAGRSAGGIAEYAKGAD